MKGGHKGIPMIVLDVFGVKPEPRRGVLHAVILEDDIVGIHIAGDLLIVSVGAI